MTIVKAEHSIAKEDEPQVGYGHYFRHSYDTKLRFISYWHQIDSIRNLDPKTILEIGIGNGFVSSYLRDRDYSITTLDIDCELSPDVAGSLVSIPIASKSFELVTCFEVLEHLPYQLFKRGLSEIYRISQSYAAVSIPDRSYVVACTIKASLLGEHQMILSIPRLFPLKKPLVHKQHYWEIGVLNFTLKRIIADMEAIGFSILWTYRLIEHPSHRFFLLRKR